MIPFFPPKTLKLKNSVLCHNDIRAYIKFLDNKKVSAVLEKLSGNEYIDTFWKYFNAYSSISEGFDEFENKFVIDKVKDWCEANSIEYTVAE